MKKLAPVAQNWPLQFAFANKCQILTLLPFSPLSPRGPLDPGLPWKSQKRSVRKKAEFKQN